MFLKNVFAPWASAICLISFGILSVANAQKSPLRLAKLVYVSPLEIPLEVSGAFGEFRPGHFHSGVDFLHRFALSLSYGRHLFCMVVLFSNFHFSRHGGVFPYVNAHFLFFSMLMKSRL